VFCKAGAGSNRKQCINAQRNAFGPHGKEGEMDGVILMIDARGEDNKEQTL
jgi:hypothetical protein